MDTTMDFWKAVRSCLSKYGTFKGRACLSEYWYFVLFVTIGWAMFGPLNVAYWQDNMLGQFVEFLEYSWGTFTFIPWLAVASRRLHDTGRSGWWLILCFTIIAIPLVILWTLGKSKKNNAYGKNVTKA